MYRVPPSPRLHVGISTQPVWKGRRRSWDCTHTPRYTCLQSILPPLVPPSLSQFCQPAALQRTHLSTSVIAHTTITTLQHRGTEYIRVPCTSLSHTHAHQGHIVHCSTSCFFPNTTAAWPKDCKMAMHIPALPISPISSSRFTRVGTEMTYSNICDPARPPAESQRSITSQILIPRKGREKKKCTQAADQSSAALPLLPRCVQYA